MSRTGRSATALDAQPVTPLPGRLAVGGGVAMLLDGRCSHPTRSIERMLVLVDGVPHPVLGSGMAPPRGGRSDDYWWAIVDFPAIDQPRAARIELRAGFREGGEATVPLGSIELVSELEPPGVEPPEPEREHGPLVAVCMATYEPDLDLLATQVESIRSQGHRRWVCLISDDGSSSEKLAGIKRIIGDDSRFAVSAAPRNQGFYRNFERALTMTPAGVELVALCDQDDRWNEDKLERLIEALDGGVLLAYSDMRVTDGEGTVLSETYWAFRRNNSEDFGSLVLANTVTGAASLFRASLLSDVLPFPPLHGAAYHDHWIAQVAMALGEIAYVDRPLYDYVQHGSAALGYLEANGYGRFSAPVGTRARTAVARWRGRRYRLGWRVPYFRLFCRIAVAARTLELRCGEQMDVGKRRILGLVADDRRGLYWLISRALRDLGGTTETLGRERVILAGLTWRRVAAARSRLAHRSR